MCVTPISMAETYSVIMDGNNPGNTSATIMPSEPNSIGSRTPNRSDSLPAWTASSAGKNEYSAIMTPMMNCDAPSSIANSDTITLLARKADMLSSTISRTVATFTSLRLVQGAGVAAQPQYRRGQPEHWRESDDRADGAEQRRHAEMHEIVDR